MSMQGLLFFAVLGAAAHGAERVDRVVAIVGERVVTEGDLRLEAELLVRAPLAAPPLARVPADPAALQARVEDLVVLRSLAGEARVYQPTARQVEERLEALRSSWLGPEEQVEFLRRHGLAEADLRGALRSRLVVDAYLLRNLAPAGRLDGVPVGDVDDAGWTLAYDAFMVAARRQVGVRHTPAIQANLP